MTRLISPLMWYNLLCWLGKSSFEFHNRCLQLKCCMHLIAMHRFSYIGWLQQHQNALAATPIFNSQQQWVYIGKCMHGC